MRRVLLSRRTVAGLIAASVIGILLLSGSVQQYISNSGWFARRSQPAQQPVAHNQEVDATRIAPFVELETDSNVQTLYGLVDPMEEASVGATGYYEPEGLAGGSRVNNSIYEPPSVEDGPLMHVGNPMIDDTNPVPYLTGPDPGHIVNPLEVPAPMTLPPVAEATTTDSAGHQTITNPHFGKVVLAAGNSDSRQRSPDVFSEAPAHVGQSVLPNGQSVLPSGQSVLNESSRGTAPNNRITPEVIPIPDSVAQKAALHVEYGKSLARRGATHAARQEFYHALRLIAQALDSAAGGSYHTSALARGIRTLREAEDFHISDSETEMVENVASIVDAHSSNIIPPGQAQTINPIVALQMYYSSGMQDMVSASGSNVVSAEAFYSLGKLHSSMSESEMSSEPLDIAKSIMYHRAAIACDDNHFRSANELGAMLAINGHPGQAVNLFKQSLRSRRTSEAWQNLAAAHRRMGEDEMARRADNEGALLSSAGDRMSTPVIWMDANQFNATAPASAIGTAPAAVRPQAPTPVAAGQSPAPAAPRVSQAVDSESPGFLDRIRDRFRR